ncbi:unnamed protein product, partial [Mesorhabditis spiculigera]
MHLQTTVFAAARIPMIKFVGARLPKPNFNRASLPPLQVAGSAVSPLSAAKPTSIGAVGKIPRGQGIPEAQTPKRFLRPLISQEECDAINAGGSYGM